MPRIHPKPGVLDGLLRFFPEERDRLLRHARTRSRCRTSEPKARVGDGGRVLPWRPADAEYGRAVDNVLARFRPRIEAADRERAEAPALLEELLGHEPERREMLARNSRRFRSLALCGLLLERSYQESFEKPRQGERLAELALALTGLLDPARYGGWTLADTRARCWIMIANARRAAAGLRGSEQAFRTAGGHLRQGTGSLFEKAQLLAYKASLRRAQRRFSEAARLFRRAVAVFVSVGESRRAAESVIGLALLEQYRGEPERAVRLLEQANGLIGPLPAGGAGVAAADL